MDAGITSILRPMRWEDESEANFVRGSWMAELAASDLRDYFGAAYRDEYAECVRDKLLHRAHVLVAASGTHGDVIRGWACIEPARRVLHFVVVHKRWRGLGVAKTLLRSFLEDAAPVRYSHRVRALNTARLPAHWTFSPKEMFS